LFLHAGAATAPDAQAGGLGHESRRRLAELRRDRLRAGCSPLASARRWRLHAQRCRRASRRPGCFSTVVAEASWVFGPVHWRCSAHQVASGHLNDLAHVAVLQAMPGAFVSNPPQAVEFGHRICCDLDHGWSRATVIANTIVADEPDYTRSQARAYVNIAERHHCP
jgi:hypothetical protein